MPRNPGPIIKKICTNCGKEYPVKKHRAKTSKFCSPKCWQESSKGEKKRINKICPYCGKNFPVVPSQKHRWEEVKKMPKKTHISPKGYSLSSIANRGNKLFYSKYEKKEFGGKEKEGFKIKPQDKKTCSCWILERISHNKHIYQCPNCKKRIMFPKNKLKGGE